MLGTHRAIVTPVAGTTRDVVEAYAKVGSVTLKLRDTAGIRETEDPIEDIGVEKAKDALMQASLILVVIDGSKPLTDEDRAVMEKVKGKKALLVVNKSDKALNPMVEEEYSNGSTILKAEWDFLQRQERGLGSLRRRLTSSML